MRFSLMFFSATDEMTTDKYGLLIESARFADRSGFDAIWTPERHFDPFGGLFPNPSVVSAALAMVTSRLGIRAGSVVLPLHHPIRVVEEWAVVDNLSKGRVGVSFAPGWSPADFALAPDSYDVRRELMYERIEEVRRLWAGAPATAPVPGSPQAAVFPRPRPIQAELPVWISTTGAPESAVRAGHVGANLLTSALRTTLGQVEGNIELYRAARDAAGHDASTGRVTLMLHTFLGPSMDDVMESAYEPLRRYLETYLAMAVPEAGYDAAHLSSDDHEALAEHAVRRYFETNGLIGTPASCLDRVEELEAMGVDEIACLIDFGVDEASVLGGLKYLNDLTELASRIGVG